MIYHLVCGREAAVPLQSALASEASLSGEIFVLQDDLQTGPIRRSEGQSFLQLRQEWGQKILPGQDYPGAEDLNRLLELSNALHQKSSAVAWFWLPPHPTDACAFCWMLSVLGKHLGRLYVLNLANLPFLDEQNKVFYPETLSQLPAREWIKARRLARALSAAELEIENEVWAQLSTENACVRTMAANRKISSQPDAYYDPALLGLLSEKSQKAGRLIQQARSKSRLPVREEFLAWRLSRLAAEGQLTLQGDPARPFKEWELSLPAAAEDKAAE